MAASLLALLGDLPARVATALGAFALALTIARSASPDPDRSVDELSRADGPPRRGRGCEDSSLLDVPMG